MIKFPSIQQYRNVVHDVTSRAQYAGKDENDNVIYDTTKPNPTLNFQGTVKLHGTNAGIATALKSGMWTQSRENIITPQSDNAGFSMFVHANRVMFEEMLYQATMIKPLGAQDAMLIFGEWCGGSIQKNVAITQFPKMFVVFGMALVDAEGEKAWVTSAQVQEVFSKTSGIPANVYNIYQFPTYSIDIDFARPHDSQNKLSEMTIAVEDECPVGKQLGATPEKGSMVGEGIVWKCTTPGYEDSGNWFKVKGEKHAPKNKVKTLSEVDVARVDAITALAQEVCPEWRLEQMLQQTFNTLNGGRPDIKGTGEFIKAVMADVLKEELDTIAASGFTTKDITGSIAKLARDHLIKEISV